MGNTHIGTEHLLIGLLREEIGFASELLTEAGLRLDEVRKVLTTWTIEPGRAGSLGNRVSPMAIVEVIENGPVAVAAFRASLLPRIGEEVMLQTADGGSRIYRVENVRYELEAGAQQVKKVQAFVKGASSP